LTGKQNMERKKNMDEKYMNTLGDRRAVAWRVLELAERDGWGFKSPGAFRRATGVGLTSFRPTTGGNPSWARIRSVFRVFPDRDDQWYLLTGEGGVPPRSGESPCERVMDPAQIWRPWSDRSGLVLDEAGSGGRIVVASPEMGTVESVVIYRCHVDAGFPDGSDVGVEVQRGGSDETMSMKEFEESRKPAWWCPEDLFFQTVPDREK